jgi:Tol biopolymer transport system component
LVFGGVISVPEVWRENTNAGWMPDAKSLLIRDNGGDGPYCIYQVFMNTLSRRLTERPAGVGDGRFSISPDGANLAFIRFEHPGVADIYKLSMEGGQPRRYLLV